MKSQALYLLSVALTLALLWLFTHLQFYKRNPFFWLWIACGLAFTLALQILAWAREYAALDRAAEGGDILYYALTGAFIATAFLDRADPVNQILLRGGIAALLFTIVARLAGHFALAGGVGPQLANIINAVYVLPTAWMLYKFSGLRIDRLPLFSGILHSESGMRASALAGAARSLLS